VHNGGTVVVLQVMSGLFRWKRCGGEDNRAAAWPQCVAGKVLSRAKAFADVYVSGNGGYTLVALYPC
jgi:hypothetical protein